MAMADPIKTLLAGTKVDEVALTAAAINNKEALDALLDEISPQSRDSKRRYNSFKVLIMLAKSEPASLYPRWDYLEALFRSSNEPSRYIAVTLIPLLAGVDRENRWDGILKEYLALTRYPNLPLAGHAVMGCGILAKVKPKFRGEVTACLLSLEKAHIKAERRALLNAYAVEAFAEFFSESTDKKAIISFVRSQLKSKSPKGRKAAGLFLKKNAGCQ
jgi:hypothetical protein